MPNEDDQELLSLGPEQAVMSCQESSTLQFTVSLLCLYKSDHFSDGLRQKTIGFVWKYNKIVKRSGEKSRRFLT